MRIPDFSISAIPEILFGDGTSRQLPVLAAQFGNRVLLLTGAHSYIDTQHWPELQAALAEHGLDCLHDIVAGEPSPALADALASRYRNENIAVVIGIGGGSVLDAAKAVAGLLRVPNSVMDFLEGVGPELPYPGPAVPFIAVPTTAGTGSEATKNAVLSQQGAGGFKKSFRHHIRSALTQSSLSIPVLQGDPALGQWQGIFLYEHRFMSHSRRVLIHLIDE